MLQDSGLEVRSAAATDLAGVLRIYGQLADERAEPKPAALHDAARIVERIRADPGHELLVAVEGERVLGTADLVIVPNLTHGGKPWAIVENMAVDHSVRRSGIGTKLMHEIEHRVRAAGGYKIQLLSRKNRTDAHAFYEALGLEPSAEGFRRCFDQPGSS